MRAILPLLALACTPADPGGVGEPPATPQTSAAFPPPAPGVTLEGSALVAGAPTTLTVTGLSTGDTVHFTLGTQEPVPGGGPCIGGSCLDLPSPRYLGAQPADAQGVAILTFDVPAGVSPGTVVYTQALVQRGTSAATTPVWSAAVEGAPAPILTDARNYIFGHSLLLHSDTANVPRWLDLFADSAGHGYQMAGQYGFMDTHAANLPPMAQWGVPGVDSLWAEDYGELFGDVDVNVVLLTEANFRQYYPPTETDPDGFLPSSTVDSTVAVVDWVAAEETGVRYLIYENWPDMAGFTSADFATSYPTEQELADYHAYTAGDFHQWWLDYHDAMQLARPDETIRLVPVGSVLAHLLTTLLADVPVEELYEDDAPHGQPTLYFLAGIVTYTAMYGVAPPADVVIPADVSSVVADRYADIVAEVEAELQGFEDADGNNRTF